MHSPQKTWHILGAGAIGSLWAIRLQQAGVAVRLILSPRRHNKHPADEPVIVHFSDHSGRQKPATQHRLAVASPDESIHNLLLATKANAALSALEPHVNRMRADAQLVSLSNGMGYHDAIQQQLGRRPLYMVTTTDGAYFAAPGQLILAGRGHSKIARYIGSKNTTEQALLSGKERYQLRQVVRELSVPGHRLAPRIDARRLLLDKLSINACINGLTAIHNCRNGALANGPATPRLYRLITECQELLEAAGQRTLASSLRPKVLSVIHATADNISSSCSDIRAGRATEIKHINGFLLRLGQELGVSTAENAAIVKDIKALEKGARHP